MTKELALQHDGHNLLDKATNNLRLLDNWNKETSAFLKDNGIKIPSSSTSFVVAEYLRTHIKEMRALLDAFYEATKNTPTP